MPYLKHKAFAYISHGHRLLVFRYGDIPEAGIQVLRARTKILFEWSFDRLDD